jgi:predicted nucleic acid-binding protein
VREVVLDASVVLKWFRSRGESNVEAARALRSAFEEGDLGVLAPPLLRLELLNVAGRRWRWDEERLVELAAALDRLQFIWLDPELANVARWTGRGLTAYDATYVAVAEASGATLVTDDRLILERAPGITSPLKAEDPPSVDTVTA